MSPFQLFLYVVALGAGLFVCGILGQVLWFLWCVEKGVLAEEPKPE